MNTDLLGYALKLQTEHELATEAGDRVAKGQVFTPPEVCRFMASLLTNIPARVKVLDAGAGLGLLSAALCERLLQLRSHRDIEFVLYETDSRLLEPLKKVMNLCGRTLRAAGHGFKFEIRREDFILAHARDEEPSLFVSHGEQDFDIVIMNPPYFKLSGNSLQAKAMEKAVHGQPNAYALFMAIGADALRPTGRLVAITPRSFCNGLYFRAFRKFFLSKMTLQRVHLFESRTDTFREAGILQESVITVSERLGLHSEKVSISVSHGRSGLMDVDVLDIPSSKVMDPGDKEMVIRLPESSNDVRIIDALEKWKYRFEELGLRVSTGPVVGFRSSEYMLTTYDPSISVPLILVNSVQPFKTTWPTNRTHKPVALRVTSKSRSLLLPTRNYLLLRRFSAKEERRRLTASCFLRSDFEAKNVAIENHVNYVYHANRELTDDEVYGLAALFNSALVDRYFRMVSGSTQVNATELRIQKMPTLDAIALIGNRIRRAGNMSSVEVEKIVLAALKINGTIRKHLLEIAT